MSGRDLSKIVHVERMCFEGDAAWDRRDIRLFLKDKSSRILICETGNQLIGFMFYRVGSDSFQLWHVAVHPDYRHQGVATELVNTLAGEMCESKMCRQRITTVVPSSDTSSLRFFDNLGFRAVSIVDGVVTSGDEEAYVMLLDPVREPMYIHRLTRYFREIALE